MVNVAFLRSPFGQGAAFSPKGYLQKQVGSEDADLQAALAASLAMQNAAEAASREARDRLGRALCMHRARVLPVMADGNCQFRALSVGLYGNQDSHRQIREQVLQQLRDFPERYRQFVYEPYEEYLQRMSRGGEWGDNVTLQAAADALGRHIKVFTDVDDPAANCIVVSPAMGTTDRLVQKPLWAVQQPLYLAFMSEVHYDAAELCPA